ncbi:MAG: HAD family hydrolase [Chloroflexi bacterium]|nr:HAD family hydrolase [Chloroflexota bacterium]
MAIRAVLFDWDGTLVRQDFLARRAPTFAVAAYARRVLSLAVRDEAVDRAFEAVLPPASGAASIEGVIAAAFTWLGWAVGSSDVDACARLFFDEATAHETVFDDARALLPSLKYRGYRTAVVANSLFPARFLQEQANALGLAGHLDAIVTSAGVGVAKPGSAPFVQALDAVGVEAHEALFVGDSLETDVVGAREAGMRAVLLQRSAKARDRSGYLVIERLTALAGILGEGSITPP